MSSFGDKCALTFYKEAKKSLSYASKKALAKLASGYFFKPSNFSSSSFGTIVSGILIGICFTVNTACSRELAAVNGLVLVSVTYILIAGLVVLFDANPEAI